MAVLAAIRRLCGLDVRDLGMYPECVLNDFRYEETPYLPIWLDIYPQTIDVNLGS